MQSVPKVLLKDYANGRHDIDEDALDHNSSLYLMLQRVGRRKDVLDVGCSTGYFAQLMASHDCNVAGLDIDPGNADLALKYCTRFFAADLDFTSLTEAVQGNSFDVIVFGDVLEHLRHPVGVLDEARKLIRAGGFVVASIPNIAHGAIRIALLRGDFDYQELGILDEAHLRFFTLKTVEELFLAAGYEIKRIDRTKLGLFDGAASQLVPSISRDEFSEEAFAQVQRDPEFDTLQFVVQAFPLTDESRLRAITKQFVKVNTELANARSVIDRQGRRLASAAAKDIEREALPADRGTWRAKVASELPAAHAEITSLARKSAELESVKEELETTKAQWKTSGLLARRQSLMTQRMQQTLAQSNVRIGTLEAELARISDAMRYAHAEMLNAQGAFEKQEEEVRRASEATRDAHQEMLRAQFEAGKLEQSLQELRAEHRVLQEFATSVQSSRSWRIKRVLNRIVAALRG